MMIHTFGAYFGLAAALVLYNKKLHESKNEVSNYVSDIFSLVGAACLFCPLPSGFCIAFCRATSSTVLLVNDHSCTVSNQSI